MVPVWLTGVNKMSEEKSEFQFLETKMVVPVVIPCIHPRSQLFSSSTVGKHGFGVVQLT